MLEFRPDHTNERETTPMSDSPSPSPSPTQVNTPDWRDAPLSFDLAEALGFDATLRDGSEPHTLREAFAVLVGRAEALAEAARDESDEWTSCCSLCLGDGCQSCGWTGRGDTHEADCDCTLCALQRAESGVRCPGCGQWISVTHGMSECGGEGEGGCCVLFDDDECDFHPEGHDAELVRQAKAAHEQALATVIARAFAEILREWLSAEEMAEVLVRNAAETNPNICHSHDFCDPNMAMLEAFMSATEFDDPPADNVLWVAAWDLARAAGFDAEAI